MAPSLLAQPVAVLARACMPVPAEDSVAVVARRLRESGAGIVPIVSEGIYHGAVTERSMAEGLANGVEETSPASRLSDSVDLHISMHATGAEALRLFSELQVPGLVVTDSTGRVLGVLAPSDLYPRSVPPPRPPMVGGMATPFGVYLTTGVVSAGASGLALVVTGMLLFCLLIGAALATDYLAAFLIGKGWGDTAIEVVARISVLLLFGLALRFLTISKIHAAEHKVVHAIERGEELTLEIVKRMPRVHPRCGTNLAVGASLFLGLATSALISDEIIRLLVALAATVLFWRPLGSMVQRFVTTSPPGDRQIEMGIRSGKELLAKYVASDVVMPTIWQRIYTSGMLHVMFGSAICSGAFYLAAKWLGIDLGV